jgi:hypothetical protein
MSRKTTFLIEGNAKFQLEFGENKNVMPIQVHGPQVRNLCIRAFLKFSLNIILFAVVFAASCWALSVSIFSIISELTNK